MALGSLTEAGLAVLLLVSSITSASTRRVSSLQGLLAGMNPRPPALVPGALPDLFG